MLRDGSPGRVAWCCGTLLWPTEAQLKLQWQLCNQSQVIIWYHRTISVPFPECVLFAFELVLDANFAMSIIDKPWLTWNVMWILDGEWRQFLRVFLFSGILALRIWPHTKSYSWCALASWSGLFSLIWFLHTTFARERCLISCSLPLFDKAHCLSREQ